MKRRQLPEPDKKSQIIQKWFDTYYVSLRSYLNGLLKHKTVHGFDAQDLVMEVFTDISNYSLEKLLSIEKPFGFLRHKSYNVFINIYRRSERYRRLKEDQSNTFEQVAASAFISFKNDCKVLLKENLTKDELIVFNMLIDGFTYAECSALLGVSVNTLRIRVWRGRQKIRNPFKDNDLI